MVNKQERKNKKRQRLKRRLKSQKDIQHDFHFLRHARVIEYIKRSKVMFIMRGLPGSGKSTIVDLIQKKYTRALVCSADQFFYHSGRYEFNVSLLSSAHSHCQERAKIACENDRKVVIIDNTNIRKWEMKVYLNLAVVNNYVVIPVIPKTRWRFDPDELANRNTHGVTVDVIKKKTKMFEDTIPMYYGWFLNDLDSKKLLEIGVEFYQECLKEVPDLSAVLLNTAIADDGRSGESPVSIRLNDYFKRYGAAGILHCTAMFCRWGKEAGARQYHERPNVQKSCGQTYRLNVTGLVITPRTLSARIRLTDNQLKLWGQGDREKQHSTDWSQHGNLTSDTMNGRIQSGQITASSCGPGDSSVDSRLAEACGKLSLACAGDSNTTAKPNQLSNVTDSIPGSGASLPELPPMSGIGRSAHITLGCADGILAKQTGVDILEIAELASVGKSPFAPLRSRNAVIYYYGEGRCEVIFKEMFKVESLFSGFY